MKSRIHGILHLLVAITFFCYSTTSLAMPKAAENEDGPVTAGVDVAKPKPSAKPAKQVVTGKPKPVVKKKPVNTGKPKN